MNNETKLKNLTKELAEARRGAARWHASYVAKGGDPFPPVSERPSDPECWIAAAAQWGVNTATELFPNGFTEDALAAYERENASDLDKGIDDRLDDLLPFAKHGTVDR